MKSINFSPIITIVWLILCMIPLLGQLVEFPEINKVVYLGIVLSGIFLSYFLFRGFISKYYFFCKNEAIKKIEMYDVSAKPVSNYVYITCFFWLMYIVVFLLLGKDFKSKYLLVGLLSGMILGEGSIYMNFRSTGTSEVREERALMA